MVKMLPEKLLDYFLYFGAMSFLGWIIETIYRSGKEKRLVNPGFLSGPFVPIYGFGAVIITSVSVEARTLPLVPGWALFLLSPTILEYFAGWLMEKFFGLKLWDYSRRRFNLQGRICLRFSFYWAVLAILLVLVIQPAVFTRIAVLGPYLSHFAAGALLAWLAVDVTHSVKSVFSFKAFQNDIAALIEQGRQFHPAFELGLKGEGKKLRLPIEIRHAMKPLAAFPHLRQNFMEKRAVFPERIREYLEERFKK
jgi:uncharacterized membrane protein